MACNWHPVKRIAVNIGRFANRRSMCRVHGQFAKARFFHTGHLLVHVRALVVARHKNLAGPSSVLTALFERYACRGLLSGRPVTGPDWAVLGSMAMGPPTVTPYGRADWGQSGSTTTLVIGGIEAEGGRNPHSPRLRRQRRQRATLRESCCIRTVDWEAPTDVERLAGHPCWTRENHDI